MKQLLGYFLVWGILILGLTILGQMLMMPAVPDYTLHEESSSTEDDNLPADDNDKEPVASSREIDVLGELRRAQRAYRKKDYLEALEILDPLVEVASNDRDLPDKFRRTVLVLKGAVHWSLWQYIDAQDTWLIAQQYSKSARENIQIKRLLTDAKRVLETVNHERSQKKYYEASPHTGPAASLKGRIALVYIFVKDGSGNGWSLRDRTHAVNTWEQVEQWLTKNAASYGSEIEFSRRLFLLDRHPGILRLKVGDMTQQFANAENVIRMTAEHFGYKNILGFSRAIKKEENADQVVMLLHIARDGRSFASRCMGFCGESGEFVFLFESTRAKDWQALEYAQAHESLHVFGADDLYNITNARNYAARDIMNYPSSNLYGSRVEDLTAYAIGIREKPPATPFRIRTYKK